MQVAVEREPRRLNRNYAEVIGRAFVHFFCPVLFRDEEAELPARHHNQQKKEIEMNTDRTQTKEIEMPSYRKTAIAVGVLFIVCTAASILSIVPLGAPLSSPVDFAKLAASESGVILTALIEFVWAATGAGIAIALFPVVRKYNRAVAVGSVAARTVEAGFVLVATLGLLVLFSLSKEVVAAGSAGLPSADTLANLLLATREWVHGLIGPLAFALGALMYYFLLYKSRLIPRWLSGWGLVAIGLSVVATVYASFTQDFGFSSVNTVLSIPILLQEMVLAVWLIAKGFNRSALASGARSQG
jgi:Domain of unknown function (DUF4386)